MTVENGFHNGLNCKQKLDFIHLHNELFEFTKGRCKLIKQAKNNKTSRKKHIFHP